MGSRLQYTTASGGTASCSSCVPIKTGGVVRLLTAGHCLGATFTNNGTQVGTVYTSAYNPTNSLSNSDIYGDWKLIQGSTYSKLVYSGATASSLTTLTISAADWGTLAARPLS